MRREERTKDAIWETATGHPIANRRNSRIVV